MFPPQHAHFNRWRQVGGSRPREANRGVARISNQCHIRVLGIAPASVTSLIFFVLAAFTFSRSVQKKSWLHVRPFPLKKNKTKK